MCSPKESPPTVRPLSTSLLFPHWSPCTVTATTPWGSTVTFWGARGSPHGVEVAELCCGAFATFVSAASQVSLKSALTLDFDRSRCAHVQSWLSDSWAPCTHICGDLTQKMHSSRLGYVDMWAIGIPFQSTSGAGNQEVELIGGISTAPWSNSSISSAPPSPGRNSPMLLGPNRPAPATAPG